mmetsp:Transcript_4874/g.13437  ORF Transcript_4874/g.13437 Transcript_4874/m.13437 type:complete len:210 (-) Transcript_4874:1083-1712(-)
MASSATSRLGPARSRRPSCKPWWLAQILVRRPWERQRPTRPWRSRTARCRPCARQRRSCAQGQRAFPWTRSSDRSCWTSCPVSAPLRLRCSSRSGVPCSSGTWRSRWRARTPSCAHRPRLRPRPRPRRGRTVTPWPLRARKHRPWRARRLWWRRKQGRFRWPPGLQASTQLARWALPTTLGKLGSRSPWAPRRSSPSRVPRRCGCLALP